MATPRTTRHPLQILIGAGLFFIPWVAVSGKPVFGTAALRNAPASGNAAANETVLGNDSRLGVVAGPANGPNYVFKGNWADMPAASSKANGDRATVLDLADKGAACEFEVRTFNAVKYWYPVGEITLAFAGRLDGTSGSASSLNNPLSSGTGATAGTFFTLAGLIKVGLLAAPGVILRLEAWGKKVGTGGTCAYIGALGGTIFGGANTGAGTNNDARVFADLLTTDGLGFGTGLAPANGTASNQAQPVALSNGSAQTLTIGYSAANAADIQNLYGYRVSLRG